MVLDGLIIGLIAGFVRGGTLKGIAELKLKYGWIFPLLLLVQVIIFFWQEVNETIATLSNFIFIAVYIIGMLFLWLNRSHTGFLIILIGVFLNFLVMSLNGGRMPVSLEAASVLDPFYTEAITNGVYGKHMAMTASTHLPFLGDIIALSPPYPRIQVISIGDVIMNIGIFLFVYQTMNLNKLKRAKTT